MNEPTPRWSRPRRTPLYPETAGSRRARRSTDVVLLAVALGALVLFGQLGRPPSDVERALSDLARAVPSFLDGIWRVAVGALTAWFLAVILVALVRRRFGIARDQILAVIAAVLTIHAATRAIGSLTRSLWEALWATTPPADPVSVRLAVATAVIVVSSPHLARPYRSLGRWLVAAGAIGLVLLGAASPSGAVIGIICGTIAATALHLALGSSAGRPALATVQRGLEDLGVVVLALSEAERQAAGVYTLDAADPRGRPLLVKVYGRDAWDTQLLSKAWRALWYRDAEALTLTRLQQAEHEGFVTLLAARNGVAVNEVVRAGRTTTNDAIIVLGLRGDALPDAALTEMELHVAVDRAWDTVGALGAAGFAHGDLAPDRFRIDGREVVVDGLAGAVIASSADQIHIDRAQLLVSSALLIGTGPAVTIARRHLGTGGLEAVLPYLQRAALGPALRAAVSTADLDLDAVRTAVADGAGVEEPKLAQLRRVSPSTLLQAALLVLGGYFLITSLAGIDFAQVLDEVRGSTWPLFIVALFVLQLPRFAQAESTRAVSPRPLPFGPVVLLEFAIRFVNLVLPSTAARVAVKIRFFQKQGIPPASAVSMGALDSFAGFVIEVTVLLGVWLFDFGQLDLDVDRSQLFGEGALITVLAVLVAIVVVLVLTAAILPGPRAWVLEKVRPWIGEVLETVRAVRSPARLVRLLGANLLAELLFASGMAIVLGAFGVSVPLTTLIVIDVCVSLFAGLMPVPGGIGITEAAFVVGLTAAGVDEAVAFAATIMYRMCTYYLPPIWGSVAFRRLERTGQL